MTTFTRSLVCMTRGILPGADDRDGINRKRRIRAGSNLASR